MDTVGETTIDEKVAVVRGTGSIFVALVEIRSDAESGTITVVGAATKLNVAQSSASGVTI